MNAYWIDGGYVNVWGIRQISEGPGYQACGVFIAETPAQAKADALREFNNDIEWNDLRCNLLVKNLDLQRGFFDDGKWPPGPWMEDETISPPEPFASIAEAIGRVSMGKENDEDRVLSRSGQTTRT